MLAFASYIYVCICSKAETEMIKSKQSECITNPPIDLEPNETRFRSNSIGEWYTTRYHLIRYSQQPYHLLNRTITETRKPVKIFTRMPLCTRLCSAYMNIHPSTREHVLAPPLH